MGLDLQNLINEFVMMYVLIDPIGTLPIFLMVTAHMKPEHRSMMAVRATLIAGCVLSGFLIGGKLLLQLLGIPLPSFQIAGGIVLFLFALTMIFGPPKAEQEKEDVATLERARSIAVFPLAIPAIASPGAMLGAVLLNDSDTFSLTETVVDLGITWLLLGITLALLFSAKPILQTIGDSGVSVLSRIMGLILAAVAVDSVLVAIAQFFKISGIGQQGLM
ncbi:MarC family protein [Bauldia sp.]|uniref:MarC family protein n=1 Tax=Bauldia sp. TaxID=2575872 RepID=UPI0025BE4F22|nr:MarC family protein [Bauldia sp.]